MSTSLRVGVSVGSRKVAVEIDLLQWLLEEVSHPVAEWFVDGVSWGKAPCPYNHGAPRVDLPLRPLPFTEDEVEALTSAIDARICM